MLVEPFLPNKAHSSGPTFTDDRTVARQRAREERRDKWLKHIKTMESEVARAVALQEITRIEGNPIINNDHSFVRLRHGDTSARPLGDKEKFLRFNDTIGLREMDRGPGEQADWAFGYMQQREDGPLMRTGGTSLANSFTPNDEEMGRWGDEYESFGDYTEEKWNGLDEESKRGVASNTFLDTEYSRPHIREYNYSKKK